MHDRPTSTGATSRYELFAGRFRLLAVDPAATKAQVGQAYAVAREQAIAPNQTLAEARDDILDPDRRLLCELAYPLDGTTDQVDTFYADLGGNNSASELVLAANDLPPLSKANFLVHLAGRQAADANLLIALVGAHAALDAAAIFEILKERRSRAGFTVTTLAGVEQGLQELQALHFNVVMDAYRPAQCAAEPLLDCTHEVLSSPDRYRVKALSGLLDTYRRSVAGLTIQVSNDMDAACEALKQRPDDASVNRFEKAFKDWMLPIAPLMLFEAHQKLRNERTDRTIARVRTLLADLIARGDLETARETVNICLNAFSLLPGILVPGIVGPFEEAATALHDLSLEAEITPLDELIQNCSRHPEPVIAALRRDGFGSGSSAPVRALWETFSQAVTATHATKLHARPWMAMRDFASHLKAQPESADAATTMISDLLRFGESLPATPATLDILRDDLSKLATKASPSTDRPDRSIPYVRTALFIILPAAMLSALLAYGYFNPAFQPFQIFARQAVPREEPEMIPPPSKGERFKREFVRYCHFQEERLRALKQHVRGPQDIQAYNMLANDYNSRCSNFYFLDEDLRIVKEEIKAKKQVLEADAERILSTWPWHAASPDAPPAK
jgi:hypothetical protein